jgi:nucleoside-diphosphate-sugar epimerase
VIYGAGATPYMLLVSLMRTLAQGEPFPMTAGEQRRDFIHVDDVAEAVAAVLERRATGTLNLGSGEGPTVREAAELGAAIAGRPELLRVGALPYRANEVFDYRLDVRALERATGWRARVSLREGLTRLGKEAT